MLEETMDIDEAVAFNPANGATETQRLPVGPGVLVVGQLGATQYRFEDGWKVEDHHLVHPAWPKQDLQIPVGNGMAVYLVEAGETGEPDTIRRFERADVDLESPMSGGGGE